MEVIHRKSVLALTLTVSLLAAAFGGNAVAAQALHQGQANAGIQEMQSAWYDSSTGFYTTPGLNFWWGYANSFTAIGDYEKLASDTSYDSVLSNSFINGETTIGNPTPAFSQSATDDNGWWALNWIQAYDVTGDTDYLTAAENLFSYTSGIYMTNAWDSSTCGGGAWWNTSKTYKNAISNELFLEVAAKLANRTTGTASATYLDWAKEEWTWFHGSGLINSENLINDGLVYGTCANNGARTFTYNQGVILSGLVELYYAEGGTDTTLLSQAEAIANAVQSSPVLSYDDPTYGDTLMEDGWGPNEDDTNPSNELSALWFKGAYMRGLADLYEALPAGSTRTQYQTFANNNAKAVWNVDRNSSNQFGFPYLGPVGDVDSGRQTSGIAALIAGARVQNLVAYPSWSKGDLSGWTVSVTSGSTADVTVHKSAGAPAGLGYFGDIRYLREHDDTSVFSGWASQDVTATPGHTFTFSVAAKTTSGAGNAGEVQLVNGSTILGNCNLSISVNTAWKQYSCTGTVPSNGVIEIRLSANSLPINQNIYYDSVRLTQ